MSALRRFVVELLLGGRVRTPGEERDHERQVHDDKQVANHHVRR
jgi:hypothetical protein